MIDVNLNLKSIFLFDIFNQIYYQAGETIERILKFIEGADD